VSLQVVYQEKATCRFLGDPEGLAEVLGAADAKPLEG